MLMTSLEQTVEMKAEKHHESSAGLQQTLEIINDGEERKCF